MVLLKCYLACEYNLAFKIATSHSLEVRGIEYSSKVKSLVWKKKNARVRITMFRNGK